LLDYASVDAVGFFRVLEGGFHREGVSLEPVKESGGAEDAGVGELGCVDMGVYVLINSTLMWLLGGRNVGRKKRNGSLAYGWNRRPRERTRLGLPRILSRKNDTEKRSETEQAKSEKVRFRQKTRRTIRSGRPNIGQLR
jgi:hypothetical protein